MPKIIAACGCNIGRIRNNNEDNFCFNGVVLQPENKGLRDILFFRKQCEDLDSPVCFGIFDGMGGEAYGEIAAYTAATRFKEYTESTSMLNCEKLFEACHHANDGVCYERKKRGSTMMGTTAVVLAMNGTEAFLANIGDSKAYYIHQNVLEQISIDHTDETLLHQLGIKNRKPRLTQHLGIASSEMAIEPAAWTAKTHPGDRFLLCSDGLTDMATSIEIQRMLSLSSNPADNVRDLLELAISNGGRDNITVIVCLIAD